MDDAGTCTAGRGPERGCLLKASGQTPAATPGRPKPWRARGLTAAPPDPVSVSSSLSLEAQGGDHVPGQPPVVRVP